ncbi:MAG: 3-deoxy-D-manno-octulosonic-acid transferase [Marinobacter sp. T13-3]|nr:MAG: 3-deoxy-D-manno-octulosonic-acid transferase [Marinobacter sp. T13-3]
MLLFIYSQLIRLALPFILFRLWWRGRKAPARRKDWSHRLGYVPRLQGTVIWVHAVSVGETIAAGPMVNRLLQSNPNTTILMTATTDTGLAQAKKMFGERVAYAYAPYDTPGAIRRFLRRVNPRILVILETEIWPNMIDQCHRFEVPVFLINARLSERSAQGYERVRGLAAPIMKKITWIAAQAEKDAQRFRRIGVAPESVEVTGSVKFDVDISEATRAAALRCRQSLGKRPIWVAGSTHSGEDVQLLEAHRIVLEQHPEALLIIVPRHPERFDSVAQLVADNGFKLARRSLEQSAEGAQVYLGDTMGELMMLYGAGDIAFVGGSLVERGGHNPLEPAAWSIPVLTGPHVFNFETIFERLQANGGVQVVQEATELGRAIAGLVAAPDECRAVGQRALEVVNSNRGALDKVVEGIVERL